jgi:hypothetical protein
MDEAIRYVPEKVNRPKGAEIVGRRTTPEIAHMVRSASQLFNSLYKHPAFL